MGCVEPNIVFNSGKRKINPSNLVNIFRLIKVFTIKTVKQTYLCVVYSTNANPRFLFLSAADG